MDSEGLKMTSIAVSGLDNFSPKRFNQVLATLIASLALFSLGAALAWTSPSIPDIERKGILGELTVEDKSWIASLVTLGALICGPFSGYIVDKYGRRTSLMILAIPMILGWGLISTGFNVIIMCIGRLLTGFALGGNIHIATVYIGEIAEEKIRGLLLSISYFCCALGILYIYVLGTFYSWFILSVTNIVFPVLLFFGMYFCPESPTHLLNMGKDNEARDALMWLRGAENAKQIQNEFDKLQIQTSELKGDGVKTNESLCSALMNKNSLKALSIALVLMMCQQLSGVNAVLFFALTIFDAAGTNIDGNVSSIIIGIVLMIAVAVNSILIDRAGRRILMMMSQLGMALSLFCLGTFFYLKKQNNGETPSELSFLPLVSLLAFMALYNIGAGPVPFTLMGELFPPRIKGFGCAFATSFNWMLAFIVTFSFESFTNILEIHGCYFMFGGMCLVGLVYCAIFVPETKGKSLDEIQKLYFSN